MSMLDSSNSNVITSYIIEELTEKRIPLDFFIEEQTRALDYFLEQSSDIYK